MNPRLTVTAAVAVVLASVSIYPLIDGGTWFWAGIGAVITAAVAGTLTRLPALQAAVAATVLALIVASPLLANPAWGWKALGAVIVAAGVASRPRVRVLQALGGLITYLAALLVYLNLLFAARLSMAGVVPTTSSLRYLWSLAGQGLAERAYAPPVPGIAGVTLLAAGGIGLMAAATDLLAVKLRSPAIAGLPLLALYSVRITTNAKQGGAGATVVFCLGMIGYLALLAADGRDRLRIWGRLVTVWHSSVHESPGQAPDTRALAASGRRIGLAAACIALAFPLLIPGVRVHDLFSSGGGNGPGSGGSPIRLPNPLVQMNGQLARPNPQTVLTYHTTAADPQEQYLQVYVLNYDTAKGTWNLVSPGTSTPVGSGRLRAAPGVARGTPEATSKSVVRFAAAVAGYNSGLSVLPVPYAPATLQVPGNWDEDNTTLMVYSTGQRLSGLTYTVTSTQPEPADGESDQPASYPANIADGYTDFPAGPHGDLTRLAKTITKGDRSPMAKAQALQNYFTARAQHFRYDLNVNLPDSIAGLDEFLFKTRKGYCQQFAFAMAGLARLAGIPSRIAVGYTAGQPADGGQWKVTTADAHAWPELYIRDVGWLRFEPTPGGPGGQGTASTPTYAPTTAGGATTAPGGPATSGNPRIRPGSRTGIPGQISRAGRVGVPEGGTVRATAGHSVVPRVLLAVAIALALALITPMTARWLIRRRRLALLSRAGRRPGDLPAPLADGQRPTDLAHAAWGELRDNLADYGLASRASESPRALGRRVAATLHVDPATRQALDRITGAEERARYATVPLDPGTLRADTVAVRRAIARESDPRMRWRARLLPASTLTPIRKALQHSLDLFGWMDAAGFRIRDRIRQHG